MGLLGKLKRATSRSKDELRGNPDQQEQRQELALPQQAPITPISIFGGSLEAQAQKQNSLVPRIVLECIQIIEQKGMNIEGIYRLSGNNGSMQRLRFFYNNYENFWIDPNYEDWSDVHVITGALKLYFRELQNPLITFAMYDKFIAVASGMLILTFSWSD
jgi:hypothetical protein